MLQLDAAAVPTAEAFLGLPGAESITLADAGDAPVLEPLPETTPLWPQVTLRAVFPADTELTGLSQLIENACAARNVKVSALRDADWQSAIRQVFKARAFGQRIWL